MGSASKETRWPNFFIVGAASAGTSSLYYYLKEHPDIFMSEIMEPHFFSSVNPHHERLTFLTMNPITREEDYLKLFVAAGTKTAVGEASTGYLYDEDAPKRIHAVAPQAKIIVLLRNPVERAYSHYLLHVAGGTQRSTFYEALQEDYARSPRGLGYSYLYVEQGFYYNQVKRYLDIFGPEQVGVYLFEDLASDSTAVVKDACGLLGLSSFDGRFFDPAPRYVSYAPRNGLTQRFMGNRYIRKLGLMIPQRWSVLIRHRVLLTKASNPQMDQPAKEFLQSVFRDDIAVLQELIGRDLNGWLTYGD